MIEIWNKQRRNQYPNEPRTQYIRKKVQIHGRNNRIVFFFKYGKKEFQPNCLYVRKPDTIKNNGMWNE